MQDQSKPTTVDWSSHQWVEPAKLIKEMGDLEKFKASKTYEQYMIFITKLQAAIESKPVSATKPVEKFKPFSGLIDRLVLLVDEVPPIQQKMRFGNTAYKDWHNKAMEVYFIDSRSAKNS